MESQPSAIEKTRPMALERIQLTEEALAAATRERELIKQYVDQHMKPDEDYGKIPGGTKPTLYKAGAEKLTALFRCKAVFRMLRVTEDYENGFFAYVFRCRIIERSSGEMIAEGYGSANSKEARYRWRTGSRKCPKCQQETIIAGKAEYGGGWICFKKKGGCGEKWTIDAPEIIEQAVSRVANDDTCTLANTILKTAKKRAHVDGALALARCSDMFTQDVEDLAESGLLGDDAASHNGHGAPTPGKTETRAPARKKEAPATPPQRPSQVTLGEGAERFERLLRAAPDARGLLEVRGQVKRAAEGGHLTPGEFEHLQAVYLERQTALTPVRGMRRTA